MTTRFSVYLYPWDLARTGVTAVLDDLQAWHIEGIHLAANYHQITALSPRGGDLRVMFNPRGAVFCPVRPNRYGRIKPSVWTDPDVTQIWHEVTRQAEARSMTLTIWTIAMFQPWMAQDYPFAARETAFGDRSDSGVCPNSPDVQEYLAHLAVDLAEQFDIRAFALEGNGLPLFDYGWIRPRVFTRLTDLGRQLMRLCFCQGCQSAARQLGLDPVALRSRVCDLLRTNGLQRDDQVEGAAALVGDEEIAAFEELGSIGAEEVVRSIAGALTEVGSRSGVLVAAPGADVAGRVARLDEVVDSISGIRVFGAGDLDAQRDFVQRFRDTHPGLTTEAMLHPPTVPGMPILTASYDYDDPHFRDEYAAALASDLDWIGVYHWGLLDESRFARTMEILGVGRD